MAIPKIQGAQRDFSFGEIDITLKRADEHPARKAGLRQMSNMRILNSGAVQNRPGRSALYPITNGGTRTERFAISPGNVFDIQFAAGRLKIISSAGVVVGNFTLQGNGAALPWASSSDIQSIVYAIFNLSIYICFGHSMRPQIVSWDGVSTWSIADYSELIIGSQKHTPFYRMAPQGITLQPIAPTGSTDIATSAPYFVNAMIGTRLRYVGRQMLITGIINPSLAVATVEESLPGSQTATFSSDPRLSFSIGDEVIGSSTGSKGIVTAATSSVIGIQLLSQASSTVVTSTTFSGRTPVSSTQVFAFTTADTIVGPGGALVPGSVSAIQSPAAVTIWDEEVMNSYRGFPASCFADQFRVGFCDFPSIPGGVAWSAINGPTDLGVGANPDNAMFEIVPEKARVYYVIPGPESAEFVFCDQRIYYIPINPTNPLEPGNVQFQLLSSDGSSQVHPRRSQEAIIYANAGQNSLMAVIATGAYLRPFNTRRLSEWSSHLFNGIQVIAAPSADGTFLERYLYALNKDGSITVGKYYPEKLVSENPVIGWGPWSGAGAVSWIGAYLSNVLFTSSYFGTGIVEILDDTQYLDSALPVNSPPAAFAPPGGKGPLWFIPSQSVTLIDQITRFMGTYQIDANGFIVPQFNDGENLAIASLVAGQPWTAITEPFCPDANPGNDVGQRMKKRRISNFAAYVLNSSGFVMARLFSGPLTPTSPALGTVMNEFRIPAWNQGDTPTLPPPLREEVKRTRPTGRSYDPRAAIIKDTPGPLQIPELGMEASV